MPDYFKMMRQVTAIHAREQHDVPVHDPYDCDREDCRLCQDFFVDEKIDRIHDERKEQS